MMIATVTKLGWQKLHGLFSSGLGATYTVSVTAGTGTLSDFKVLKRPISSVTAPVIGVGGSSGTITYTEPSDVEFELEVWGDVTTVGTFTVTASSTGSTQGSALASYATDINGNVTGLVGSGGLAINLLSEETVPASNIDFLSTLSNGNYEFISVPSPYAPAHVLHPSVQYFKDSFNGYKYWMAFTPYPNGVSTFENPSIVASVNGSDWVVPNGVINPLFEKPIRSGAYNSDTDLYYDSTTKKLVMLWRVVGELVGSDIDLYISTSANGIDWDERTKIWHGTLDVSDLASPSIWYNSTSLKWEILGHNVGTAGTGSVNKITSDLLLTGWDSSLTLLTCVEPAGRKWWHSELRRMSNGSVVGVVQDNNGTVGASGNLYTLFSSDGLVFSYSPLDLNGGWYRPSFIIRDDILRDNFIVEFFGSKTNTSGMFRKKLLLEKGISQLPSHVASAYLSASALGGIRQILIGDTFNRTDSAVSLGTSTSGGLWASINGPTNVLGINGNKCYNVTTGNCRSIFNVGVTDHLLRAVFDTKAGEMYIITRYIDASNYIRIGVQTTSQLKVETVTGGVVALSVSLNWTPVNGDEIIIRSAGSQLTIWGNSTVVGNEVVTQGLTSTNVGIAMSGTLGGRIDNFLCTSIN